MPLPDSLPTSFTRSMALAAGVSDDTLQRYVKKGTLLRVRNGIYRRVGPVDPTDHAAYAVAAGRAELLRRRTDHALSHLTAAAVHGLPLPLGLPATTHLTALDGRATQRSRTAPGVSVHHADSYPPEVVELDDQLVTTPAQTVADCLRTFPPRVGVPIADGALRLKIATPDEILDIVHLQCHWPGRVLRTDAALPLVDGRRESWLESYAAVVLHEWGLPDVVPQLVVRDEHDRFVARVDGGWPEDNTVLELDGRAKYALPDEDGTVDPGSRWHHEKDRYDAVGNLGYERVRFGLGDLLHHRGVVESRARARRAAGRRTQVQGRLQELPDAGMRLVIRR